VELFLVRRRKRVKQGRKVVWGGKKFFYAKEGWSWKGKGKIRRHGEKKKEIGYPNNRRKGGRE